MDASQQRVPDATDQADRSRPASTRLDAGSTRVLFEQARLIGRGSRLVRVAAGALPVTVLMVSAALLSAAAQPQFGGTVGARQQRPTSPDAGPNQDPFGHSQDEQMAIRRTTERQKAIVDDTAKLLQLAQELKADVDKSNKDQLSISVVKKAEEVEKLAKAVKDKMRGF